MLGNEMSTLTQKNLSLLHLFQAKCAFLNQISLERQLKTENSVRLNILLRSYFTNTLPAFNLFEPYLTLLYEVVRYEFMDLLGHKIKKWCHEDKMQ